MGIIHQDTGDNDYIFLKDQERAKYEADGQELMRKRRRAIDQYRNVDRDRDALSDGMEIQVGLHSAESNKPLHKPINRAGLSTPGPAFAGGGGIQFPYDSSIISLSVKPTHSVVGGDHKMKTPKPMKLSVDFGTKMDHISSPKGGFNVDFGSVHPERHRLDTGKIKRLEISQTIQKINNVADGHHKKMSAFEKKYSAENSMKREGKENKDDIKDLSLRLSGFIKKQKRKSSGVDLIGGKNLDFSHIGITTGLANKKKKGFSL